MANNEVKLKLSVDGTQAVLSQFDRVRSGMTGVSDAATTMGSVVKGMAAAFSVGAVAAWARSAIDAADAMNDMSQRVGIAVKDLAKYELAVSQSGTTMESLSRGIKGLAGNLADHGAALKKAGIDTTNADTAMQGLADVFASMPDGVEKTNLAVKLFGKSGMEMIPMLNLGSKGLQTAAEKSAAYATQMAALAPLADEFNDNTAQMALQSRGVGMIMLNELMPSLVKVTAAMAGADETGTSLASLFGKGLKIAFQTVALIASDVVFVFKGIGREIGGIAAQVVAAATGNWAGFSAISDAMKADAAKAREELDRFQDNLVNGTTKVQDAYNKRRGFGETIKTNGSGAALLKTLGADKSATEAAKAANALLKEQIELAKWNTKAVDELFDAQEKQRLGVEDQIRTARTTLEQIEFETRLLTMNTEQRALATMERELERQGIVKGTLAYDAYIKKLREATAIKSGKEEGIKATEALAEANKKAAEESAKYWEDALMRAFESGKGFFESLWDTIKNTLKTQVLKVLVSATGLSGMSAAGAADGGLGGSLGQLSGLSNLYSGVSGLVTLGSQVVAGTMSLANALGTVAANATGTGISGLLATNGAFGTAAAGSAAGIGGSITAGLAAIPGWGWAAIAAAAIIGMRPSFVSAYGTGNATRAYDAQGRATTTPWASEGGMTPTVDTALSAMYTGYAQAAKMLGAEVAATSWYYGSNSGREAQNPNFRVKASVGGKSVYDSAGEVGLTEVALKLEASRAVLAALQASEMPGYIARAFDGVTASIMTQEQIDATLTRAATLKTNLTQTNAWLGMLRNRLLDVSLAGSDAANSLVDAFGSLDAMAASSKAYYDTFYTEAERTAISTENLTKALALVNVALPTTKDGFRAVVSGLDLTTESGRSAYAVMLALAPEFASTAAAADKMAADTAAALIKTFTGNGQLVPILNAAGLAVGNVAAGAGSMTGALFYINVVMGDARSGVITLGGSIATLGTGLTASQQSATRLTDQMVALQDNTDRTRIDFAGLGAALASVDTTTFVNTIALVFDNLANRIGSVVDSITAERVAVREAALQIINPTVMSKEAIARSIAGISTGLPSNAGVTSANATLAAADSAYQLAVTRLNSMTALNGDYAAALAASQGPSAATITSLQTTLASLQALVYTTTTYLEGGHAGDDQTWVTQTTSSTVGTAAQIAAAQAALDQAKLDAAAAAISAAQLATMAVADLGVYTTAVATTSAAQTAAADAAKRAALDYAASLQTFAIDAGKSVAKLSRLREETVKYYDAQKALADLMSSSASGLRKTVGDYRYGQLSPEQQLASLQTQFSSAYNLAQATQGDGATLAGYGDRVNALLGPLIDKLAETNKTGLIANYLAQAESVANLIDAATPVNYQQDSLALLGSIDATLAALDASSRSAEQIIADAVAAGAERTATGLRTIGEAISGQSIPAFAGGGSHSGGLRVVGERGWEVESTGPSHIFNQQQLGQALRGGGNTARLEALVERQAKQLEAMSYELRAIAVATGKSAKALDGVIHGEDAINTVAAA